MVFDWFRRTAADVETPPEPADAAVSEASGSDSEAASTAVTPPTAASGPPPEASVPVDSGFSDTGSQATGAAAPAAATPPPVGAVDEAALEWARQAYARLKAQQQSQPSGSVATAPVSPSVEVSATAEVSDTTAEAPSRAVSPPAIEASAEPLSTAAAPEPQLTPPAGDAESAVPSAAVGVEPAAPLPIQPSFAEPQSSVLPTEPDPLPPPASDPGAALSPSPPSQSPPGLSLLERAAAQRQQRLQELSAAPPPAAVPEPVVPPPVSVEASEPTLGAFDDTFTWSAEVLAAQGRSVDEISLEEIDWLGRLRQGLEKTRRNFVSQLLENLGDDPLTPEVLDDLETTLLRADVGVQATDQVLEALRRRLNEEVVDPAEGLRFLKQQLRDLLEAPISASEAPLLTPQRGRLNVWLMVGVNGVGKTTTLGKLANLAVRSGYSCLIAAADTFRAAAVQQVQVWGERSGVPVVSNPSSNADPAAVVYDAIGAAKARGTELVLVDTAGRLQTKHNLMEELSKVRRIVDKLAPEAVVESLLVLDASQGQNGLRQAMAFASAAGLTGVVITKLDGSARGGVALAVASEAGLPIRFIGAGEGIRDLRPFNSFEFVEALLAGSR